LDLSLSKIWMRIALLSKDPSNPDLTFENPFIRELFHRSASTDAHRRPRPISNLMLSYSQFMKLVRDLLSHACLYKTSTAHPLSKLCNSIAKSSN
jgi:hypothetical protein